MKVDESVLNQILDVLDYQGTDVHLLGGYFNNVYEISSEVPIIVKIFSRGIHREEEILSEIEWTQFLHENGVHVTVPIILSGSSYIHNLTDDLFFVAYEKVKGPILILTVKTGTKNYSSNGVMGWGQCIPYPSYTKVSTDGQNGTSIRFIG
ncbi:phosphotransferase [Paenibacillus sp. JTLBN-2024]